MDAAHWIVAIVGGLTLAFGLVIAVLVFFAAAMGSPKPGIEVWFSIIVLLGAGSGLLWIAF